MSLLFLPLLCLSTDAAAGDNIAPKAISIIERNYLWDDELDPSQALVEAAEAAEDAIPWLIVEVEEDPAFEIRLIHGESGEFGRMPYRLTSFGDLRVALTKLEVAIRSGPGPIEDSLDLEVEFLRGIGRSLDRYSIIMHKDRLRRFNERIKGKLSGIGCRVRKQSDGLRILEVFPDGPAFQVGLQAEDVITHVDGASIQGLTVEQGVERLRGEKGTSLSVTVQRPKRTEEAVVEGEDFDLLDYSLVRANVRIPNVKWRMEDDGIGYISIENFSEQTYTWLERALRELEQQGPLKGLVIDLRGNSGGSMIQACKTVDAFLSEGIALRTVGRDKKPAARLLREYRIDEEALLGLPIVVLIDRGSASASEIVAGALKLNDRALLIGQKTHGKGVVQLPYRLRVGTDEEKVTLKMTVAQYLLTDDFSVHDEGGVEPHIQISPMRFGDYAHLGYGAKGLIFADERTEWRELPEEELREDFPLDLALQILMQTSSPDVAAMRKMAEPIVTDAQDSEWLRIEEAFSAREVDWRGGVSGASDFFTTFTVIGSPVAGEEVKLKATVHNPGEEPLYRSKVYLDADDSGLAWDDLMIPVGYVPPGESRSYAVPVKLPSSTSSRMDMVQVFVQTQGAAEKTMSPVELSIQGIERPRLSADLVLRPGASAEEYTLSVVLRNMGDRDLSDIDVKLQLPNSSNVEFRSADLWSMEEMPSQSKLEAEFAFVVKGDLEALGDFQLRVDADGFRRNILYESKLSMVPLYEGEGTPVHLQSPEVHVNVPTAAALGHVDFQIVLKDDGRIEQTRMWLDGEQIEWHGELNKWSTSLDFTIPGGYELTVKTEDEQGLTTTCSYHVWALSPPTE
jgi:C-terminal peptidase prc